MAGTTGPMGFGASDAAMTNENVVMVAERAVGQLIDDLRGELGLRFQGVESAINEIKSETEQAVEDLSAAMTDAFKQNNASLRNEIASMKGDLTQDFADKLETLTNELKVQANEREASLNTKIKELEETLSKNLASELSGKEISSTNK